MKKLAIIFFVLFLAVTANSQVEIVCQKQIDLTSNFSFSKKPIWQNTILSQNSLFDEQDKNEPDGIDFDLVLPEIPKNFQQNNIKIVVAFFPRLQIVQLNELLLDLPPPLLSV